MDFFAKSATEVMEEIQSSDRGLTDSESARRLVRYGANIFSSPARNHTRITVFLNQWKSPLIIILAIAGIVSFFLHDGVDSLIIGITVLVNVLVGFFQEDKANQALKKLAKMVNFSARVLRSGIVASVPASEITIGDVLLLEPGDKIPADGRVIESVDLTTSESALTGESSSVSKNIRKLNGKTPIALRSNMVYQGTHVVGGRGKAVIVAVGSQTEMGRVARLVSETEETKTPLQIELGRLSGLIGRLVLCIAGIVFIIGLLDGEHTVLVLFQTAVALAVAAIPEGLTITLTVILAIGMQFLLRRNALVRKMVSAETLGSITVICTDKTGTLTEGKMAIEQLVTAKKTISRSEIAKFKITDPQDQDAFLFLRSAVLCTNVRLSTSLESKIFYEGDSTEVALVEGAEIVNIKKGALDIAIPRISELPFDSKRKYMAVLNQGEIGRVLYVKGAYDILKNKIISVETEGKPHAITQKKWEYFDSANNTMAGQGLRVLAVCYRLAKHDESPLADSSIHNLVLVGLVGLADPIREGVRETIIKAQSAGIRVVMITGDQASTARAIAFKLGIGDEKNPIISGQELAGMNENDLAVMVKSASVFSRVNPEDKIKIVRALKNSGEIVAMTGDGVNDSPALKGADIGVAMGSGTDIAREIADLVLLDDRFETIVSAVEEGRSMYRNIKKVVLYLLSFSLCEVALIIASLIAGFPLALLPAQILWLNLVQDSLPAIALAFDRAEPGIMNDAPRPRNSRLMGDKEISFVGATMLITSAFSLGIFVLGLRWGDDVFARTMVFAAFGFAFIPALYSIRLLDRPFYWKSVGENFFLNVALLTALVLLFASLYLKPMQNLLGTVSLGLGHLGVILGFCAVIFVSLELTKRILFKKAYALS